MKGLRPLLSLARDASQGRLSFLGSDALPN